MPEQTAKPGNGHLLRDGRDPVAGFGAQAPDGEKVPAWRCGGQLLRQQQDGGAAIRRYRKEAFYVFLFRTGAAEVAVLQSVAVFFVPRDLRRYLLFLLRRKLPQIQLVPQYAERGDIEAGGQRRLAQRLLVRRL